jgi:dUTP pyrophosphatase
MTALSREEIRRLLEGQPPLLESCLDIESQLQPNGFDISVRDVCRLVTPGTISVDNNQRVISEPAPMAFGDSNFIDLAPGPYLITHNEVVHLPNNVMALGRPRSSLLRCGVTVNTAVWDAGYSGRSQSLLVVCNELGFRLQKDARVVQLVFFRLTGETEGYRGRYQGENM